MTQVPVLSLFLELEEVTVNVMTSRVACPRIQSHKMQDNRKDRLGRTKDRKSRKRGQHRLHRWNPRAVDEFGDAISPVGYHSRNPQLKATFYR